MRFVLQVRSSSEPKSGIRPRDVPFCVEKQRNLLLLAVSHQLKLSWQNPVNQSTTWLADLPPTGRHVEFVIRESVVDPGVV